MPETQKNFFLGVHMKEWIGCWGQGVSRKELLGLKVALVVVRTLTGVVLILSKGDGISVMRRRVKEDAK